VLRVLLAVEVIGAFLPHVATAENPTASTAGALFWVAVIFPAGGVLVGTLEVSFSAPTSTSAVSGIECR
jgi:hypothetical protein